MILTSWFLATGSQWDFVQAFGWGRMFVGYSSTMTVSAAVERTFSGEMCEVCRAVRRAKRDEGKTTSTGDLAKAKVILYCAAIAPFAIATPDNPGWWHVERAPVSALRAAPPVPPPRVG